MTLVDFFYLQFRGRFHNTENDTRRPKTRNDEPMNIENSPFHSKRELLETQGLLVYCWRLLFNQRL